MTSRALPFHSTLVCTLLAFVVCSNQYVVNVHGDQTPDRMAACTEATDKLIGIENEANQKLLQAERDFEATFQIDDKSEDLWTFGFPEDALKPYKDACFQYNEENDGSHRNGLWKEQTTKLAYSCDSSVKNVVNQTVEFYGLAECVANTTECRAVTAQDMAVMIWNSIGLECSTMESNNNGTETPSPDSNESTKGNSTTTNSKASEESDTSNQDVLTPGENKGSDGGSQLPFMTDDDLICEEASLSLKSEKAGLRSAEETYKKSETNELDKATGSQTVGYPADATSAFKSACELNHGFWVTIKDQHFQCAVQGMEVIALHVTNFGACLAKTAECQGMDPTHPLLADLAEKNIACWEDNNNSETETNAGEDKTQNIGEGVNNDGTAEDMDGSKVTQDEDANDSGTDEKTDSTDNESNPVAPEENTTSGDDNGGTGSPWDDLGLSDNDIQCLDDSEAMMKANPNLDEAIAEFAEGMILDTVNVNEVSLTFPDEVVHDLKYACETYGGAFTLVPFDEFNCDTIEDVKVTNIANCVANTDECKQMDPLVLMEKVWEKMGAKCHEIVQSGQNEENNASPTGTTESSTDSLAISLGLSESEVACLHASSSFMKSSPALINATSAYEKTLNNHDPTRLGYPFRTTNALQTVCSDVGGYWAFVQSDDVTCDLNNHDRCINVYNFGFCMVNNADCMGMDPMNLVRGFFKDVLDLDCHSKCSKHKETSSGGGTLPQPKKNGNFQASSGGSSSDSTDSQAVTSYTTIALAACIVVGLGFMAIYRYRASHGRERIPPRAYEMSDISDLRFESLT